MKRIFPVSCAKKRRFPALTVLAAALVLTAAACAATSAGGDVPQSPVQTAAPSADGPENDPEAGESVPEDGGAAAVDYSVAGTVFTYDGVSYDLREQGPLINAITDVRPCGGVIVLYGHVNPNVGVYCIFDTEQRTFVKSLAGANLTWTGDDVTTAVYSFWSDIFDYHENLIASCELGPSEFICGLALEADRLTVAIYGDEGDRTETYRLSAFTNVMGLDGTCAERLAAPYGFYERLYRSGGVPVAESFGFDGEGLANDYILDLDGDGTTELICNCVTGGDGHESVYVYRRNGDLIERGFLPFGDGLELPGWFDWGVNSTSSRYTPGQGFTVSYTTGDGDAADTAELTLTDISAFRFEEYAALPPQG